MSLTVFNDQTVQQIQQIQQIQQLHPSGPFQNKEETPPDVNNQTLNDFGSVTDLAEFFNIQDGGQATKEASFAEELATQQTTPGATEFILGTALSNPTGTQKLDVLDVTEDDRKLLAPLKDFHLNDLLIRLEKCTQQLQAQASQDLLLNPLLLSEYIPDIRTVEDLSEDQISGCFHKIQSVGETPAINGIPIWERHEWEKLEYYHAFKLYREMKYMLYNGYEAVASNRSLYQLATKLHVPTRALTYLAAVYAWDIRTSYYDNWRQEVQQKRDYAKRMLMTDRHSVLSQALITKAFKYLNTNAKLSPKEAIEVLKLGMQYERLSAGMYADKPGDPAASTGSLLTINTTTTNTDARQLNVTQISPAEQKLHDNMKKTDTLSSILGVLQRSGALDVIASTQDVLEIVPEGSAPAPQQSNHAYVADDIISSEAPTLVRTQ